MAAIKKVLIIDDEVELCQLLKNYFIKKNHKVYISHTLKEGMALIVEQCPDIVFIDNNLPDGIGWSVAPIIANDSDTTFLVLISGYHPDVPEMPSEARYKIIEKPISFLDIEHSLEGII